MKALKQKEVLQPIKIKEEVNMKRKSHFVHLKKFNQNEFSENVQEFFGYLKNRNKNVVLNPDKLVNLLYIYFRSVLLYPSSDTNKYYVIGKDGKTYEIKFQGHNKENEKLSPSISQMSNTLFNEVALELLKSASMSDMIKLVELFTQALATPILEKRHKYNIINAENSVLNEVFTDAIRLIPEQKAIQALDLRQNLAFSALQKFGENALNSDTSHEKDKIELEKIIAKYIRCKIDVLIANNKFIDIFKLLYDEIEKSDDRFLITTLLNYLVVYNNLFLLEPKDDLLETIEGYRNLIGEKKYNQLEEILKFSPERIELTDFSIRQTQNDNDTFKFRNVDYQKVRTIISFVIPYESSKDYTKFEFSGKSTIEFKKLKSLFDDPIFLFLNKLQQNINGMPTTIFSDAVGNIDNSTVVYITIPDFFHPDFEIIDDKITYINFEETEAKLGRKYYPYKDRIVEMLRDLYENYPEQIPISVEKNKININLISNHLINYIDENNTSVFYQVNTVTNLDSYLKVKRRYLEKITDLNLSDEFIDIRTLLFETEITTPGSLRNFLIQAIDLTVKKSIELRGIYKFMWKDKNQNEPLNEPDIQPIIKTHLQPILEAKGIQISRETVAANGSLDFLCTYTNNNRLFKVGIELKKAHHGKLLNGLTQQLPQYLMDEGSRQGIFLVLWFKNDNFKKPIRYNSIPELINDLDNNIPKKYNFKNIVIDCTKKPSPSKQ